MSNSDIRLINLETGGNQAYIFATNKLRNVVGASELLYRVGTSYVERAVKAATGRDFKVAEIAEEPQIDAIESKGIEVIVATSGKALLLARGAETARKFIREWSRIVADEAPGVDAAAVFSKTPVDLSLPLDTTKITDPEKVKTSYMEVYHETERLMTIQRTSEGMPVGRFPRLPIVAECAYSGLPVDVKRVRKDDLLFSASSLAQRRTSRDAIFATRMKGLFPGGGGEHVLRGLDSLENLDWLAVVHADGNGLGQLFINFADHVKALVNGREANGRDYITHYRAFSSALDKISRESFIKAVEEIWPDKDSKKPDIVPIVVGGDDLTVVMDGYRSLEFTKLFMEKFCDETARHPDTKDILKCAGLPQLGMCAGVSIVKPHFPFSQAYDLAEGLMNNAKQVKNQYGKDSIALDFHILYDSVSTSIADIRERLKIKEGNAKGRTRILTAKPYVIRKSEAQKKATEGKEEKDRRPVEEWEKVHDYKHFENARYAIAKLPSSQAHAVRDALFSELVDTQESEWEFLLSTYKREGFEEAWGKVKPDNDNQLYVNVGPDPDPNKKLGEREYTYFLDALEALKFQDGKKDKAKGKDGEGS